MIQTLRWRQYKTLLTYLSLSSVLVNSFVPARIEKTLSTFLHGTIQAIENSDRGLPVDARIGNRHAVLEVRGSLCGNVLPAFIDIGLDHHTGDVPIATAKLRTNVVEHLWLVIMVFFIGLGIYCYFISTMAVNNYS